MGEIENNEMHLSDIGKIAETCWIEIPDHFPFVKLHAWIIMPNHVHGIIEILPDERVGIWQDAHVETLHATSLPTPPARNQKMASISPPKGSLGSVIRSYKSAVSKQVHILHRQFGWQERYYDNIIKDVPAYQRIETYIQNMYAIGKMIFYSGNNLHVQSLPASPVEPLHATFLQPCHRAQKKTSPKGGFK